MDSSRPIGFWLTLVDRMIDEQFASTLEEHGVTRRQWQLLSELSRGSASVDQLDATVAPFLSADDHESSVEHLTELIDSGWVDATDVGYEVTDRGRIAADRLAAVVEAQRTLATEGVTAKQYENTVAVLEKVARNLGWND